MILLINYKNIILIIIICKYVVEHGSQLSLAGLPV